MYWAVKNETTHGREREREREIEIERERERERERDIRGMYWHCLQDSQNPSATVLRKRLILSWPFLG